MASLRGGWRLRDRAIFGLLGIALLLNGCAPLDRRYVGPPEIAMTALTPVGDAETLDQFQVELLVRNPNRFALAVVGVDIELGVNGLLLARGLSNAAVTVPASDEVRLLVEAAMVVGQVSRHRDRLRLMALDSGDRLSYEVAGRLYLANNGISSIPFARSTRLHRP